MSETDIQFFIKSETAWQSMLADILNAQKTIYIEQYIFAHDSVGEDFINALIEKAKQGVSVRLFLDGVGSYSMYNSTISDELRSFGIQIKYFNPAKPWRITNFTANFFRDHRKIMIIDNTIAHLGGVGIQANMKEWRDTHMRIIGPVVEDIEQAHEQLWRGLPRFSYLDFRKPLQFIKKYNLLINMPVLRRRMIYRTLLSKIHNAKTRIYLTTPYFIPDTRFFRELRLAARRGIDVRIVLPSVADHLFIDHARESYFTLALESRIKIYLYKDVMMHAKTAIVDEWATAGSFNFDSLSFFYNHEANIASTDALFVDTLHQHFLDDLRNSEQVTFDAWIQRSFRRKFLEILTWPFHRIL